MLHRLIKLKELPSYFYFGIKWNSLEVIVYNALLILHQTILFYACKSSTFGLIATVFSSVYLSITIFNLGLDKSLTTFFKTISNDKKDFISIFIYQVVVQFIIILFFAFLFYLLKFKIPGFNLLTKYEIFLIIGIFISESFRKTFKSLAQLAFLNNQTAILEICSVLIYVTIFWSMYHIQGCAKLDTALIPLFIESFLSLLILSFIILRFYKRLSENLSAINTISVKEIIFNRINIFATQITNILFSSNFILPVTAFRFGLNTVGVLQISKSSINFLYLLLERAFGITSGSLLTRVKNDSIEIKQKSYNLSVKSLYKTIAIIFVLTVILSPLILLLKNFSAPILIQAYLFGFAILSNTLFISQEQLLLVEEKIYYLMYLNIVNALIFIITLFYFSLNFSLILFFLLRIITLNIISYLISYKLKIKTPFLGYINIFALIVSLASIYSLYFL